MAHLTLDHLVITCTDLTSGSAAIEEALGLPLSQGGKHAAMGTHNRLLSLGPNDYLEVIAVDPAAEPPSQPRWYNLDNHNGPARLTHWAARNDDLDAALGAAPPGTGRPWALQRSDLRWRMAIPADGTLPFGGLFPALLEWQSAHPAPQLEDKGARLKALLLTSPEADALRAALAQVLAADARIAVTQGPEPRLSASIDTPRGLVTL
ncbi:MAG: VOC family protein [Pseudomonadota bacterium]